MSGNNYKEYIEALNIFNKYENNGNIHAEHDEIWAGPNPDLVSTEDKARLEELGWNDYGDGWFHRFT